jgi:tetratricopeptide (TPR) repeat protein
MEDFETVLRLKPSAYEAMVGLSNVMIDARKYPQAGQYLAKALNYEKKNDKMWSNYGNLLLHFNMYQKAYNVFRTATRLDPTNRIAQNGWGISLLENDELDRSIQLFDSLVAKNPTTSYLLNNRGIVHAYLGNRDHKAYRLEASQQRYQWAFNDFKEGLLNAPNKRFYNVNKGNVHRIWEEYDLAQTSYEAHQDKSALNNLGVMYAGMQRPKDGLYYLNIALQIDSTYRVFKYNMALLIRTSQARTANAVASAKATSFGDIGIKYSRDGFVTIYLYDYEYDTLHVKGAHYVPPPAEVIQEDFFIPIYNFKLLRYSTQKLAPKKKKGAKDREQRVKLPGRRSRTGTECPV